MARRAARPFRSVRRLTPLAVGALLVAFVSTTASPTLRADAGPAESHRDECANRAADIALSPEQRREHIEAFSGWSLWGPPGTAYGHARALVDFTVWEVTSGHVDPVTGSMWWRSVNGFMVADADEARTFLEKRGWLFVLTGDQGLLEGLSSPARAWVAYAAAEVRGDTSAQILFWNAHQRSLHRGVRCSSDLLAAEPTVPRAFDELAVQNVDLSALLTADSSGLGVFLYANLVYPNQGALDEGRLAALESLSARNLAACGAATLGLFQAFAGTSGCVTAELVAQAGVDSTRW